MTFLSLPGWIEGDAIPAGLQGLSIQGLQVPEGFRATSLHTAVWLSNLNPALPLPDLALFRCGALAGTFDYLHEGHRLLLTLAAHATKHLMVGVVSAENSSKAFAEFHQPLAVRLAAVEEFLALVAPALSFQVSPVYRCSDAGKCTLATSLNVDGVVGCSEPENVISLGNVNQARGRNGLEPLTVYWKQASPFISSTAIRSYLASI